MKAGAALSLMSVVNLSYRFRYRGLRLLVESNARLFLVPAAWIAGSRRTLVIPYDNTVKIHLVVG